MSAALAGFLVGTASTLLCVALSWPALRTHLVRKWWSELAIRSPSRAAAALLRRAQVEEKIEAVECDVTYYAENGEYDGCGRAVVDLFIFAQVLDPHPGGALDER